MGSVSTPEYESLEGSALHGKTEAGTFEHNGSTGRDGETDQFGRSGAIEPASIMANDLLIQSDTESQAAAALVTSCELDVTFGFPVEEKPIWVDLYESVRDVFFPTKLPPLELTSTPIPVPDRMAVKPNPWAIGLATSFNVGLLALLLTLGVKTYINNKAKQNLTATPIELTDFKAPKKANDAGGGGGSHDNIEAIKGKIPPRMKAMDVTPKLEQPPLPSIDVQKDIVIPDNPMLPNFGMSKSANVKLASGGNGSGMGLGSGNGNGYGPGSGGNIGGGLYQIGGGVSAPVLLYKVDPEFSEEARRAKYQGVCIVSIIVDVHGNPQNPRVVRPLGMGLDEKAIEAVMKDKFKPAMKDGKTPVPVQMNVEIDFRIY
jgi:TonB family protein